MVKKLLLITVIVPIWGMAWMGCGGDKPAEKQSVATTAPNTADKSGSEGSTAPNPVSSADDRKLQSAISDKIKAEATLKEAKIEVSVSGGTVHLSGTVKTTDEKDRAEDVARDAAKSVKPDAGVLNDISIAE